MIDDEKRSRDRVKLAYEDVKSCDPNYYETQLIRAVESVLSPSPFGWDRTDIRREFTETREVGLSVCSDSDSGQISKES